MSQLFSKKIGAAPVGALSTLVENFQSQINARGVSTRVTGFALATEALDASQVNELSTSLEALSTTIEGVVSQMKMGKDFTKSQKEAAAAAGVLAGDVKATLRAAITRPVPAMEGVSFFGAGALADGLSARPAQYSAEAYDEKDNRNAMAYSVAYNMQAARQDEFGEALFPTVVVTPDQVGYSVTARLLQVYDDVKRNISGALDNFNKKNILLAAVDPTILKNDLTAIVPVHRAQSAANFASEFAGADVVYEGETIKTAPLKPGNKFSLLAISQTETLLQAGVFDTTDSIDPALDLKNLYISVTDGAATDIVKFNVMNTPTANFVPSAQALDRLMVLNYSTTSLMINKNTKQYNGAALAGTALASVVTGDYIVRIAVDASGSCNLEIGDTVVYGSSVSVASVQDKDGNYLALNSSPAKEIVTAFATAKIVGYDLHGYRTNLNHRQRGQLLTNNYYTHLYAVPLRSPITVPRPVSNGDQTDASDLAGLITATHLRTSISAVDKLLEADATLAAYVDSRLAEDLSSAPEVLGIGRLLTRASYIKTSIDMATAIDSIKSQDRAADIRAVLVNQIRDMAARLYRDSNYKTAADAQAGGTAPVPTVIVATDPYLAQYIMVEGDLRVAGSQFEVKVVSTLNRRMSGKIFVTFGYFGGQFEGVPNALHFGNMAWKPELTVVMPVSRNGQTSKELIVAPAFKHIVNLPVLGRIDVTGVSGVVAAKVPVNMHSI